MIDIYSDEITGYKKSFQIFTSIWGEPKNCLQFEKDAKSLFKNKKHAQITSFHASELNSSNWNSRAPLFIQFLQLIFNYTSEGKLYIQNYFESKKTNLKFSSQFKSLLKDIITNPDPRILDYLPIFLDSDFPVIYHRMDQLYLYFLQKHIFGGKNEEFRFYPDSIGKVLSYNDKIFFYKNGAVVTYNKLIIDLVNILDSTIMDNYFRADSKLIGLNHKLVEFKPTNDKDSYLIQACDVIGNLLLNVIRVTVGFEKSINKKKADLILNQFSERELISFTKSFEIEKKRKQEVLICKDEQLNGSMRKKWKND